MSQKFDTGVEFDLSNLPNTSKLILSKARKTWIFLCRLKLDLEVNSQRERLCFGETR